MPGTLARQGKSAFSERPREPRPEDFNLSPDRLKRFEQPFHDPPTWAFVAGIALEGFFLYRVSRSIADAVFLSAVLWFIPVGFLSALHSLAEQMWYRKQADRGCWEAYQNAKREYSHSLELWMMMQKSWWRSLSGRQFESRLADLFTDLGHLAVATGRSGDGGIDLMLLQKESGKFVIVQCKAHKSQVGPAAVRDLYGTLVHGGQQEGWLISSSGFSKRARDFAEGKPLRLFSIDEILRDPGIIDPE